MTACTELEPLLAARSLGVLEPEELARLDSHVPSCDQCRAFEQRVDQELASALPPVASPEGAWELVSRRIREACATESTVAVRVTLTCTFCHDPLARDETLYCAGCLAPHHEDCFSEHAKCAAPGCGETRTVRPQTIVPRRKPAPNPTAPLPAPPAAPIPPVRLAPPSSLAPVALVAAVVAGLGGVAAFGLNPTPRPRTPAPSLAAAPSPSPSPSPERPLVDEHVDLQPTPARSPTVRPRSFAPNRDGSFTVLVASRDLVPGEVLQASDVRREDVPPAAADVNPDRLEASDPVEGVRVVFRIRRGQILTRSVLGLTPSEDQRIVITNAAFSVSTPGDLSVDCETIVPDGLIVQVSFGFDDPMVPPIDVKRMRVTDGKFSARFAYPREFMAGRYVIAAEFEMARQSADDLLRLPRGWRDRLPEARESWANVRATTKRWVGDEATAAAQDAEFRRGCRSFLTKATDCFESLDRAYLSAGRIHHTNGSGEVDGKAWLKWVKERAPDMAPEEVGSIEKDLRFVTTEKYGVTKAWRHFLEGYWLEQLGGALQARTKIESRFVSLRDDVSFSKVEELAAMLRKHCETSTTYLYAAENTAIPSELREELTFAGELEVGDASRESFGRCRKALLERLDARTHPR